MRFWNQIPVLVLFSFLFLGSVWKEPLVQASVTGQFSGSFVTVNPSSNGGELGAALLFEVSQNRSLWIGPRLGGMWVGGPVESRVDFQFGLDSYLWMMNAIGLGLEVSAIDPSRVYANADMGGFNNSVHYRINPHLSLRFLHFQKEGAWAFKLGVPYDSLYQWGFQVGVSLQLSGVP
jgi:hypothetical protein